MEYAAKVRTLAERLITVTEDLDALDEDQDEWEHNITARLYSLVLDLEAEKDERRERATR